MSGDTIVAEREQRLSIPREAFTITHIRGHGPGGQHRNKVSTGVRIVHNDSGAVGEATDSRSQHQNLYAALERLTRTVTFQQWARDQFTSLKGRGAANAQVGQNKPPDHLLIEVRRPDAAIYPVQVKTKPALVRKPTKPPNYVKKPALPFRDARRLPTREDY